VNFSVACPCPDGLMQDGTQEGNEAYVILHRGARSRGYKRCGRARTRERERRRGFGLEVSCLRLPLPRLSYSACLRSSASCVLVFVHRTFPSCLPFLFLCVMSPLLRVCCPHALGRPWTSPFIDTRRWPSYTMGCSYVLMWLAENCLEP
jgi:hypothetical protein